MKTKVSRIFSLIVLIFSVSLAYAGQKEVEVSCSEPDAVIYANGSNVGTGRALVIIKAYSSTVVEIKKQGFFTYTKTYYNDNEHAKPPKTDFITLVKNDSFEASVSNDMANKNFDLTTNHTEDKAWKLIVEIVTNYFDDLETNDKSTGYLKTSWIVQTFKESTVRTRLIIKPSSASEGTLKYKAKIESEVADGPNVSVKDNEKFKPWDRVLKKYSEMLSELLDRMK